MNNALHKMSARVGASAHLRSSMGATLFVCLLGGAGASLAMEPATAALARQDGRQPARENPHAERAVVQQRQADPRQQDPRQADPRQTDPRQAEQPRQVDPRSFEGRQEALHRLQQAQPDARPDAFKRNGRLTPDERRDLRRQINEAGQDIYRDPPHR